MKKFASVFMSMALAASVTGVFPTSAFAEEGSSQSWLDALIAAKDEHYDAHSYATDDEGASLQSVDRPSAFDLRNVTQDDIDAGYVTATITKPGNYVTPVKLQNPWGTCWGFSAIAASETSVLTEYGLTYEDTLEDANDHTSGLNLSELHLAYFAGGYLENESDSQYGEGRHMLSESPDLNWRLVGGRLSYATTVFSSGTGPVPEDYAPYKNKEKVIVCYVTEKDNAKAVQMTLTEDEIVAYEEQGATVTKYWYASDVYTDKVVPTTTEEAASAKKTACDWTVSEDLRSYTTLELEESNKLPDLREYNSSDEYTGYSTRSLNAVKDELLAGHAVSVTYCAMSNSKSTISDNTSGYFNDETAAQCVTADENFNHAVAIVGWDDNYSADNFNAAHRPAGDGAFIVKNSWGAGTETFPNKLSWGAKNSEGQATGYFYLSYYDRSITHLETFDFDTDNSSDAEQFVIEQYDYLPSAADMVVAKSYKAPSANVFTAERDLIIRTLTCQTAKPNTEVVYEVYLLDGGETNPTNGTLAYSNADSPVFYDMSGFHRLTLSEDDWVPAREGQRYAVVITQRCVDDGNYYQVLGYNLGKGGAEEYDLTAYYKGVINEGESYSYSAPEGESTPTWLDLTKVAASLAETEEGDGCVFDNFPIKAYSEMRDYASLDTLSQLQAAIDAAKARLASCTISADGTDVTVGTKWVTQAEYDALAAAIAAAEATMAEAGADWQTTLTSTTPNQQTADDALAALTAADGTYVAAAKDGLKASSNQQAGAQPQAVKSANTLAKTGDATVLLALGALATLGVASAAALRAARRR